MIKRLARAVDRLDHEQRRRFYGYPSEPIPRLEYRFLKDLLPPAVTADTYLVAKEVTSRYLTDWGWYPREVLPGKGGTVVEVGAYLGHKTMRFVDECVGTSGRVLAIEMIPEDVQLLRRNIEANGLEGCVEAMQCGVWKEPGLRALRGKGRQRDSLVNLDKLGPERGQAVPTDTLDNILRRWGVATADFLVVTANGAEIEVLEGLQHEWERVKAVYVAACYTVDGVPTYDRCLEILKRRGSTILPQTTQHAIYAAGPRRTVARPVGTTHG